MCPGGAKIKPPFEMGVSDFEDERGEVCMINRNEIDNICGLGEVKSQIENDGKEIERIISLDDALESVSKSIGDNSIWQE